MPGAQPSPYSGVPGQPPGSAQNRAPLFIALGGLGVVILIGLIVLLMSGGDDDDTTTGTTEDPNTSETLAPETTGEPATTTPPDTTDTTENGGGGGGGGGGTASCDGGSIDLGSDIEMVECGFSTASYFDDMQPTIGFIVNNQSGGNLAGSFTVTFKGESGSTLAFEDINVEVLPPGEFGVGHTPWDTSTEPVASVDISWEESSYPDDPGDGSIEVSNIQSQVDGSSIRTSFSATSTYSEEAESPKAHLIFRDSSGSIVGGSNSGISLNTLRPNEASTGVDDSYVTFDDLDESGTEVYVDFGYTF